MNWGEKMETEKCACEPTEILIFPCSGGSNVGQIANDAARELTLQNKGKMYCLAGLGGHVSAIIESTKAAKKIVAIDGCAVACTKKTLEHAGFSPTVSTIVTELGVKKVHLPTAENDETQTVVAHILEAL